METHIFFFIIVLLYSSRSPNTAELWSEKKGENKSLSYHFNIKETNVNFEQMNNLYMDFTITFIISTCIVN